MVLVVLVVVFGGGGGGGGIGIGMNSSGAISPAISAGEIREQFRSGASVEAHRSKCKALDESGLIPSLALS